MKFANEFKTLWWAVLTVTLTWIGAWRLGAGAFNDFDKLVFVFWFIIILLPIISEISMFGVNVKKEIENVAKEMNLRIAELKMELFNHNQNQTTVNIYDKIPVPAKKDEYDKKVEEEFDEFNDKEKYNQKIYSSEDGDLAETRERLGKILQAEKLVMDHFASIYGERFRPKMKFENEVQGKDLIVDGVILKENKLEIVEIKFISNLDFFYYIALRWLVKIKKFESNFPVRFVLISDRIEGYSRKALREQINHLKCGRLIDKNFPLIKIQIFKLEDNKISEVEV